MAELFTAEEAFRAGARDAAAAHRHVKDMLRRKLVKPEHAGRLYIEELDRHYNMHIELGELHPHPVREVA